MLRVAIATCAEVPELDEDGPFLLRALADRDVQARPEVWDDPAVSWDAFDAVVLRSTWDYPSKWQAFLSWIDDVARRTRLMNSAAVVRWNVDKRYLRILTEAGLPVVPTCWLEQGAPTGIPASAWNGRDELVVKPAISAGSKDTGRFTKAELPTIERLVASILDTGRPVMLQPYMRSVDEHGETALLYFRGRYSHAIRKGPLLAVGDGLEAGLFRQEVIDPRTASADERTIGEQVLETLPFARETLTYARVDLVRDDDGAPRVIEVELIEPSMFLQHGDDAAGRFADAIAEAASLSDHTPLPT